MKDFKDEQICNNENLNMMCEDLWMRMQQEELKNELKSQ